MKIKHPLKISICVVLFRAEEGTIRFHSELLQSLRDHQEFEILYYDNSPTNVLRELLAENPYGAKISYIHDPRNFGFSYANNQLILMAIERKILLLNPDVYGFTPELWDFISSLDVSNCARFARLLNADGSFQDCVGETVSLSRAFSRRRNFEGLTSPTTVGMGIMAFMLADKSVFAHVGLLDCGYRLYAEDMDWCYRAARSGYPSIFDPRIVLTHTGGASAKDRWNAKTTLLRKYFAEGVFIDKHCRGMQWVAMRILNAMKRMRTLVRS